NVARVVHRLGGDCLALYPAGGVTGQSLQRLLDDEQVPNRCIDIAAETRESFSVHERNSGLDFRFVLPGPTLQEQEWRACLDAIQALPIAPRYLVASGSLPPGVPTDFYAQLSAQAKALGCHVVLDTSGPALAAALTEGVYLFKPSLRELRDLTGQALADEAQWCAAARQLIDQGRAQIVALSLGEDGAVLVTADRAWRAPALQVAVASTIGAGDSFLGGLVWALSQGQDLGESFRHGMASGAAALLSSGTSLCHPQDVARLHQQVVLRSL
ncbi:MAG TPA: 1-phosphofructokinase family hexose kinase, partial [Aquabacterium sp.]|nr:1-phosphofructokinase family hexose kinase [Aquabacterium sp.]